MSEIVVLNLIWISFSLNTLSKSFLIFPPPGRHVVEHEFLLVSTRVETFSRGKRIRNERKLEKELFCSRFEPVESIYRISMRGIVRKILGNFLSDEVRTDQSSLHLELFLHNYSFGQVVKKSGVKRIEKRNGIIRKIRINEEESTKWRRISKEAKLAYDMRAFITKETRLVERKICRITVCRGFLSSSLFIVFNEYFHG